MEVLPLRLMFPHEIRIAPLQASFAGAVAGSRGGALSGRAWVFPAPSRAATPAFPVRERGVHGVIPAAWAEVAAAVRSERRTATITRRWAGMGQPPTSSRETGTELWVVIAEVQCPARLGAGCVNA